MVNEVLGARRGRVPDGVWLRRCQVLGGTVREGARWDVVKEVLGGTVYEGT